MLAGLPTNEVAAEHWLELRQLLLSQRFRQTTLTNFEREEFKDSDQRFVYEQYSFRPDAYEAIGFGPTAISFAGDRAFQSGRKTLNAESASAYTQAVASNRGAWSYSFTYDHRDLRIFYLTRRLAALGIDQSAYVRLFDTDVAADFSEELAALQDAALVEITPTLIRPTSVRMFYADSIAGLLASKQLEGRRRTTKRSVWRSRRNQKRLGRAPRSTVVAATERVDQKCTPQPTHAGARLFGLLVAVVAVPLLLLASPLLLLGVLLQSLLAGPATEADQENNNADSYM